MKPAQEKVIFENAKGAIVLVILMDDFRLRVDFKDRDGFFDGSYAHFVEIEPALRALSIEIHPD